MTVLNEKKLIFAKSIKTCCSPPCYPKLIKSLAKEIKLLKLKLYEHMVHGNQTFASTDSDNEKYVAMFPDQHIAKN